MTPNPTLAVADGNSVELQYDEFGDWRESTAFMRTSAEFAADPIGAR